MHTIALTRRHKIEAQKTLNICDADCAVYIIRSKLAMEKMAVGEELHIIACERACLWIIPTLVGKCGCKVEKQEKIGSELHFIIRKVSVTN